ncbi:MAG: hypothetical protein HEP71_15245 [Roseivirga sp.]|nr:hypothetical protein [Roseivirga sp.]
MKKPELKRLTREGLMIVFSVLFALFISQLVDDNKTRRQKDQALDHIFKELETNKGTLERWIAKHGKIESDISRMIEDPNDSMRLVLTQSPRLDFGVITSTFIDALLGDTAWEAAKSTQIISEFDFNLVEDLTRIYGLQKIIMNNTVEKFSDVYFDRASHEPANLESTLIQLQLVMNEIVGQEGTLIYLLEVLDQKFGELKNI